MYTMLLGRKNIFLKNCAGFCNNVWLLAQTIDFSNFLYVLYRHADTFLEQGPHRIGSQYKKAVYKQFRDASYSEEVPKPAWLGFLGPVLKAEVGDVIVVHLKNFASRSYSLHPHGVFYEKDAEGKRAQTCTLAHTAKRVAASSLFPGVMAIGFECVPRVPCKCVRLPHARPASSQGLSRLRSCSLWPCAYYWVRIYWKQLKNKRLL